MSVDIPTSDELIDVSNIRQIPDNQEVYMIQSGDVSGVYDKSLIFELLQKVQKPIEEAIKEHLEDLVGKVDFKVVDTFKSDQAFDGIVVALVQQNDRKDAYKEGAPVAVLLLVCLVRLDKVDTDVLISLNVPVKEFGEFPQEDVDLVEAVGKGFKVDDWGLFA